jgi:hypothetical protein
MCFEQVDYLANSGDFADQCGGQLDLMKRGDLSAQDDRAAAYLDINQTQSRKAALIEEKPRLAEKFGGIGEFLVGRIFTHVHASLLPRGLLLQTKKADVTERPQAFQHVGLLVNELPGTAGLLFI